MRILLKFTKQGYSYCYINISIAFILRAIFLFIARFASGVNDTVGLKSNSKGEVNKNIDRKIDAITIITYFYIFKAMG